MSCKHKSVCVVLTLVFWQLFLLTVTLWFQWLCRKSLWLTADDSISDQTRLLHASVDSLGTLTRLNSIADAVNCFGYNARVLGWVHVFSFNEALMARHGVWIISGHPMGLLPEAPYTQNIIQRWLWILTNTEHFAWVSIRAYLQKSCSIS